jgi:arabinogalactan endo-1,4-beta-galactosidase
MSKMKAQGTIPEYVSLGNETADGILFPDGQMTQGNHVKMAELFNQGYDAVKAVSPDTVVMIHLDGAGDIGRYDWYFGEMDKYGVKYDMIGASYYPFWTGKKLAEIVAWAQHTIDKFDKDIFIMEIGTNWNHVTADNVPGQLTDNGSYNGIYSETPEGQYAFTKAAFTILRNAANGRIRGALYWDPVMIAVPGVGWALHGRNVVSNTTLFDFNGNALKVLSAFEGND